MFITNKKGEEKKVAVKGEISDLIDKVKKELDLSYPDCGSTPYVDLFSGAGGPGVYTGSSGQDVPDVDDSD